MSAISTLLTRLQNTLSTLRAAIWAIDVRDDIADAIEECGQMVEQCYSDVSNPTLQTEALEAALQNKIDQGEMAALTIGDRTITAVKLANGVIPAADATLTTSGGYADAAETGRQIGNIKADLGAQTGVIGLIKDYYIKTSDTPISLIPISSSAGRMYAVVDCTAGDEFVINAYSDSAQARVWCFIDSANNPISMADAQVGVRDLELIAPNNAAKLIINDMSGGMSYKVGNNLATKVSSVLSDEVKEVILDCFKHVAWIDKNGEACYDALAEALNFDDFYNTWVWDSSVGNITIVKGAYNTNQNVDNYPSRVNFNGPNQAQWGRRRTITADRGRAPAYYDTGSGAIITGMSPYYPIPIPAKANHVKVTMEPSGQFMFMHTIQYQYADGVYGNSIEENRQKWTQLTNGVFEKDIINPGDLFLVTNFKYDSAGTSYPVEPSYIKIEFSEV